MNQSVEAADPTPDQSLETAALPTGWDPFEVWRNRILLPRQARQLALTQDDPAAPVAKHPAKAARRFNTTDSD